MNPRSIKPRFIHILRDRFTGYAWGVVLLVLAVSLKLGFLWNGWGAWVCLGVSVLVLLVTALLRYRYVQRVFREGQYLKACITAKLPIKRGRYQVALHYVAGGQEYGTLTAVRVELVQDPETIMVVVNPRRPHIAFVLEAWK